MNLLVTGAFTPTEEQLNILEELGNDVLFMQNEKDDLPCDPSWVEGVVCNGLFLHHSIENFTSLKHIQLTSAGLDRVPLGYIEKENIKLFNARGVYSIPMAEYALCGVLQLYKNCRFFVENQKAHRWEKHRGMMELCGKTVAIVGMGSVGNECASRFSAFGCKVLGVDLFPREDELYEKIFPVEELKCALGLADIVVLTLPLTDTTKHLINDAAFDSMKQNALLVNIARGGIVDTEALIKALENKLGGAVLDVFEDEPLCENSPLWDTEKVIITPHNSFVGEGNNGRLFDLIVSNFKNR